MVRESIVPRYLESSDIAALRSVRRDADARPPRATPSAARVIRPKAIYLGESRCAALENAIVDEPQGTANTIPPVWWSSFPDF